MYLGGAGGLLVSGTAGEQIMAAPKQDLLRRIDFAYENPSDETQQRVPLALEQFLLRRLWRRLTRHQGQGYAPRSRAPTADAHHDRSDCAESDTSATQRPDGIG
jgi:hypothetical protein